MQLPKNKRTVIAGMDWGRTHPFSFHAAIVLPQETSDGAKFNRIVTFYEAYGTNKLPKEWGAQIKSGLSNLDVRLIDIDWCEADPKIFVKGDDGTIAISDQFIAYDEAYRFLHPGSNDRIGGWENMHNWLSIAPDGLPYWLITMNCRNLIRTLPELIHDDPPHEEDVDTNSEDHAPDEQRYMLKRLKWIDANTQIGVLPKDRQQQRMKPRQRGDTGIIDLDKFERAIDDKRDWRTI